MLEDSNCEWPLKVITGLLVWWVKKAYMTGHNKDKLEIKPVARLLRMLSTCTWVPKDLNCYLQRWQSCPQSHGVCRTRPLPQDHTPTGGAGQLVVRIRVLRINIRITFGEAGSGSGSAFRRNVGSGSALQWCGSATLVWISEFFILLRRMLKILVQ